MASQEKKYGHVFVDGEDQYLLIRVLGIASEASAQLVVHVQTGELIVRKVNKLLLNEQEKEKQDPERILFLVQSQARLQGVEPNVIQLYSAEDVPAPPRRGSGKLLYHRVKYFKFYNGGNLRDLIDSCLTRSLAPPPSLICKMLQEIVQALSFIYSFNPYILHGDPHSENIFLHWEQNTSGSPQFWLGDFGWSTCGRIRAGNRHGLPNDIIQVWMHTRELLGVETNSGTQSDLRQYLDAVIEPELHRLAYGPASQLPNLAPLLDLLSAAPAVTSPPDMRPFMLTAESRSRPSPLLYGTWKEARNAQGIHGPWHVAEVSINPSTGKLHIMKLSPHTYHRSVVPLLKKATDNASDESSDSTSTQSEDWVLL